MRALLAMDEPIALDILSEKTLHHAVNPRLVAYCPSMDLLALVTMDQQVLVFRHNGQRVFTVTQKARSLKIDQIRWKPNGRPHCAVRASLGLKTDLHQVNYLPSPGPTAQCD